MMVIINGRVIGPRGILERHCVLIDGHRIKEVAPTEQILWSDDTQVIDAAGDFVAPGLVDMHVHGGLGRDTMEGSVEALAQIAKFHATGGTTTLTPTLMSDSPEKIRAVLAVVGEAMGHDFGGAQIAGAHIEGPYISPAKCGAQSAQHLRPPDPAEYQTWWAGDGVVTQVTLAPELPGALALIDDLLAQEILPSGGHTSANGDQIRAALDHGLCHATHLFNAMSTAAKSGPYRIPGALETFLADDRVMVELIADGHHVHPTLMKLAVHAKGVDRICLITDATAGAGLPDGSEYHVGATRAVVRDGVGMMPDGSVLAGSVSTMITMVRNMVEQVGVSLPEAVRMASLNPARAIGISGHKGSLEPRQDADIVIFSPAFTVKKLMVGGQIEYEAAG